MRSGLAIGVLIPAVWLGCSQQSDDTEAYINDAAQGETSGGEAEIEQAGGGEGTGGGGGDEFMLMVKPKPTCVALFAGQRIRVGTVCVAIEARVDTSKDCGARGTTGAINVTYSTTDGWELTRAHVAVGDSISDIPVDDEGNPLPGQFPYDSGELGGVSSHGFVVPLCTVGVDGTAKSCDSITTYFAAHAALRKRNGDGTWQTETGWGDGERIIETGNWSTFFTMALGCGTGGPVQLETCQTSFARGDTSTCFIGADFDRNGSDDGIDRWGWSNGPLAPGTGAAWPVYAAANACDVAQGTRIGSLSVSYSLDGNVQIVFERLGDFVLDEENLHVGTEPLPRPKKDGRRTVAPGRYPIVQELDNATHTENHVSGLHGDIYVVYHAVACESPADRVEWND